jgi:flagellar export protein FliJ
MQALDTMIRLHKFQLDDKRRKLRELRDLSQQLQMSLQQLDAEVAREQSLSAGNVETQKIFNNFKKMADMRKVSLLESIERLEQEVTTITDEIAESFTELKRFEITKDDNLAKSKKHKLHQENEQLDEVALQRFRRG